MTTTPPYPRQPVALAIVEVKHPAADPMGRASVAALKNALKALFPIHKTEQMTEFMFNPGVGAAGFQRAEHIPRFVSRDRQSSVTYRSDAVVIETTSYPGWTAFKELVEAGLDAREDVAPVDGVERIGIRYIDEIRVPGNGTPVWQQWVDASLTGPTVDVSDLSLRMLQQQSVVQYISGRPGETLTLRYGAVEGPPAVASTPNLIRVGVPQPGPYFLLDTDAAWSVAEGMQIPPFEPKEIIGVADHLHRPMKELFERLISKRLREEVLNGD